MHILDPFPTDATFVSNLVQKSLEEAGSSVDRSAVSADPPSWLTIAHRHNSLWPHVRTKLQWTTHSAHQQWSAVHYEEWKLYFGEIKFGADTLHWTLVRVAMQLDGDVTSFLTLHCTPDTYHHRHHHHRRHHHRQFVIVIIIVVIVVLIIIVIFAVVVVVIVNSSPYSVEIIYWMKVLTPADSNNLCNIRTSLFICRLCIIYQNLLLAVYFLPLSHSRDLPSVSPITALGAS